MSGFMEHSMSFLLTASLGSDFKNTFDQAQKELAQMQDEINELAKIQTDITAYEKQQKAVEASRKKLEVLQQQYDNIQKEIDETGTFSSKLENNLLSKKEQIEKATQALQKNEDALAQTEKALKDAGIDTDNLADETDRLTKELEEAKKEQSEAAKGAKDLGGSYEAVQDALVSLGALKVLEEIAKATWDCVESSIEYESALTGVYKTVDGTEEELEAIDKEIRQMATEIPATTTEIAQVAEAAGQLGIATEDVMDFTRVMIDLGESTNLSADEAASSLAKFANITGTVADDYGRLGSVIVDLGNNFATTEADIVAMATRLASSGTLVGLSESEIMALAASMSSVGIEAEAGGTAMSQTLATIEKAVSKGGKDLKEFAKISGMSSKEFTSAWATSPIEAVLAFTAGLGELDKKGESATLVLEDLGLSGIRQSNMLKSLGLASETLAGAVTTANTAWEENTALTIEAEKRYATTESKLKMLENSFNNMKIAVGDVFAPAVGDAAEGLNELLQDITAFIEENPEVVKGIASITAGFGTFVGGLSGYVAITKTATLVTKAFSAVMASNPAVLVAAGIAGVTVALGSYIASTYEATEAEQKAEVERKRLVAITEELSEAQKTLDSQRETEISNIEENAYAAENLSYMLDELMGVENKSVAEKEKMARIVAELNGIFPDLNYNYDKEKDVLTDINGEIVENTDLIRKNIEAKKEQALAQVYMDDYIERLKIAKDAEDAYNEAVVAYEEASAELLNFQNEAMANGSWSIFEIFKFGGLNDEVQALKGTMDTLAVQTGDAKMEAAAAWEEYSQIVEQGFDTAEEKAADGVKGMDKSEEAGKSAAATIDAYVAEIKAGYDDVEAAYANMPRFEGGKLIIPEGYQSTSSFSAAPSKGTTGTQYAEGTDSAEEGWALVGEEGPEMVYFGGGEKVYTAKETRELLQIPKEEYHALHERYEREVVPFETESGTEETAIEYSRYREPDRKSIIPMSEAIGTVPDYYQGSESYVEITIAPKFVVEGGNVENLESRLEEFSRIVTENVMEALEQAGIDKKRSVYA